jgi:signal transduction histidine kinase
MTRLVGWAWAVIMVLTTVDQYPEVDVTVALAAAVLATVGASATVIAARDDRSLGNPAFVTADGIVSFLLAGAAWAANAPDFISGGYPMSWLFVVAYSGRLPWTVLAATLLGTYYAFLHGVLDLGSVRTVGSIQFVVVGLIAGWAFDTLREREGLRLSAEEMLRAQQQAAARQEERANLARRLHDSVLQTLHVIRMDADDPAQVRYLARRQERELRRTIDEFRSPHERSFRAELMGAGYEVEDLCRIEVDTVIRDDAALTPPLAAAVAAAREAMVNAAKHSGATQIHLYSEIIDGKARVNVRDRGRGMTGTPPTSDQGGLSDSLVGRVTAVSGTVVIESAAGKGTDVTITVPSR